MNIKNTSNQLLSELNLADLSGEKRQRVLDQLEEHFSQIVLDVLLSHLSPEQFEKFKEAIRSKDMEAEVAMVAAQVPGLDAAIEMRMAEEYKIMKSAMS